MAHYAPEWRLVAALATLLPVFMMFVTTVNHGACGLHGWEWLGRWVGRWVCRLGGQGGDHTHAARILIGPLDL